MNWPEQAILRWILVASQLTRTIITPRKFIEITRLLHLVPLCFVPLAKGYPVGDYKRWGCCGGAGELHGAHSSWQVDLMENYDFELSEFGLSAEDMQPFQQAYPSAEDIQQTGEEAPVEHIHPSSAGSTSASTTQSTGAKRTRASTSAVWNDFDKKIKTDDDGNSVRYAVCKICGNELTAKSSGGTGHLQRHAASCKRRQGIQMRQTQLQYNPDGSVRTWEYNPEFLKGLMGRQNRTPTIVVLWSILLASVFLLWVKIDPFIGSSEIASTTTCSTIDC